MSDLVWEIPVGVVGGLWLFWIFVKPFLWPSEFDRRMDAQRKEDEKRRREAHPTPRIGWRGYLRGIGGVLALAAASFTILHFVGVGSGAGCHESDGSVNPDCVRSRLQNHSGGGGFCTTHTCIGNFNLGHGYIVQCNDGEWSHSGGEPGACSYHGGER